MYRLLTVSVLAFFLHLGMPAKAEQISWEDLIDQAAQDYEDPYLGLDYDQLDDLRTVVQETARLKDEALTGDDRETSAGHLKAARSRLAEDGIDAEWLIDQRWVVAEKREKAATAANPEINGEMVTLAGFVIPAPPAEDGTRIVYLVPERGMCSHMPPPNPNQMIRARLSGDWSPRMIHEPVQLTGKLSVEETHHVFRIVDGNVPMRASFVMDVEQVATAEQLRSDFPTAEEWAAGLADRVGAAGKLQHQKVETGN